MTDAKLDIVLSAKDMSQQAFTSLKKNIDGVGGSLDGFASKIKQFAAGYSVYATIVQAIESAKIGSALEKQASSFANLADAAGTSSKRMLENLKAASQGMVAESDLMSAAGKAMLMSIPADKISELMKIAAATSKMTGQSITEAFNDITMGVARQSRMILDNLGIIVDVDKANGDYARSLGKTADSLSDVEKRQAFMNAVLKSGADMISRLGTSSKELTGVNELIAAQTNLWNEVNKTVAQFLDKELSGYAKMINWIDEKLKGMRSGAGEITKSDAWKEIEMLRSLEAKGMAQPGTTAGKEAAFNARFLAPQLGLKPSEELKRTGSFSTPAWSSAGWREREGNFAANTDDQNKAILKARDERLKKIADDAKKAADEIKKLHEEVSNFEQEFSDAKTFAGEGSNYERMQVQLRSGSEVDNMMAQKSAELKKQAQAIYKLDEVANQERWFQTYVEGIEDATRANEIFKDSMNIMSQSFADAFAGFVTGTKSAKEAFQGMVQSVIAGMVRMATQSTSEQLMGLLFKAGSSLVTAYGGGSTPTGMGTNTNFSGGGSMGSYMGLVKHRGGTIDGSGPYREMPAWMVATAPRLHNGLAPDEFPAVLQRGERVVPKGKSGSTNNVTINVAAPGGRMDRESLNHLQTALFASLQRAGQRNA
jgi:hypothetical protein